MSRKRKTDLQITDTTTAVAESPTTEPTPTATAEPQATEPTATTVAERPATEAGADGQSFAGKLGQKKSVSIPDPFGIAKDYSVGVSLYESRRDRQMAIQFGEGGPDDKPSQAVIDTMKAAGFRWNSADRIWAHPLRADSAMSTRIDAERLFHDVCKMIRDEKGITAGPEIPF